MWVRFRLKLARLFRQLLNMFKYLLSLLIFLIPLPAFALSCMQPSIPLSYQQHSQAAEAYGVFAGTFQPMGPLPQVDGYNDEAEATYSADYLFYGSQILLNSDRQIGSTPIEVRLECAGPWCPNFFETQIDTLAFIELDGSGAPSVLHVGACPGTLFQDTPENRDQIRACMAGRACETQF